MIINQQTRYLWAEKTFELTNIGAGTLIFGQFFSSQTFSWQLTITGLLLVILGYIITFLLLRKKK